MIESDRQNFVILHIVDSWKMQFPIKIKVFKEVPEQAHLTMKNVPQMRKT